ncbi:hypothetical protein [Mariniradius sediminis]|uniref:DUF2178 domain-containing protein n=1 Tax=Mariniradius sediminis TaxID=2909237 RepID=A0ABS9BR97_9BACT|nr:hypothetical protein [Mariniradius sediminis]MCF1750596.1 hypothetical protein [Mariniradius sediminis]
MRKTILLLFVAFLVIGTSLIWYLNQENTTGSETIEWLHFTIILIVVAFALFVAIQRYRSLQRGQPAEDEMSKKLLQKTAALSYYISLYWWVALLFIKDRVEFDTEQLMGSGILGMALIFAVVAVFLHFKGLGDE